MDEQALIEEGWTLEQICWARKFMSLIRGSGLPSGTIRLRREQNSHGTSQIDMTYKLPNDAGGLMIVIDYPMDEYHARHFEESMYFQIKQVRDIWNSIQ